MRSLELSEFILTRLETRPRVAQSPPGELRAEALPIAVPPSPPPSDEDGRGVPLHRQIYRIVRIAILERRLLPGVRLPSTRDLSADLGVSRNTVIAAINELLAEGYLVARRGSGTYVAANLPDTTSADPQWLAAASPLADAAAPTAGRNLSARGRVLTNRSGAEHSEVQPFVPGVLDVPEFPFQVWARLQAKYWRYLDRNLLDYGNAGGYVPLRRAIAQQLALSRGVRVTPEQVLITSGTQQAIDLAARLLTDPGDVAWTEDPCYWGALRALQAANLELHPVPVDEQGLAPRPEDWARTPRLIYVTPSHQYPLGHVMSLARREALLAYAADAGAWIFEDDYDNEVHYTTKPFAALQGMDRHGRVIYAGTFSKVMYPGVRLGYLVVPPDLVRAFDTGLYDLYRPGQLILQAALTDFINEGHMAALIRRLRVAYKSRRDMLAEEIRAAVGAQVHISGTDAGLHLCVSFRDPAIDDVALADLLGQARLQVRPLSGYYAGHSRSSGLVIGYAYVPEERIRPWGEKLGALLREFLSAPDDARLAARLPSRSGERVA